MAAKKVGQAKPATSSGIEMIGDLSALFDKPSPVIKQPGRPLELSIDLIDEDPAQPRVIFDEEALAELSETIFRRGVKTPISVRLHDEANGRYIINHGARRYRASLLAGKTTIPAFIDSDYTQTDQVIENLQREGLTSREIADYIGRELASGKRQVTIARALGKSRTFVSHHVTLLDLPPPIAKAFSNGIVTDVSLINDLVVLYRQFPADIDEWFASPTTVINRESVRTLRLTLKEEYPLGADCDATDAPHASELKNSSKAVASAISGNKSDPGKLKKAIVSISYDGRIGRLILSRRPSEDSRVWIACDDDGLELDVAVEDISLLGIIDG